MPKLLLLSLKLFCSLLELLLLSLKLLFLLLKLSS